jgi:hypothetical protein
MEVRRLSVMVGNLESSLSSLQQNSCLSQTWLYHWIAQVACTHTHTHTPHTHTHTHTHHTHAHTHTRTHTHTHNVFPTLSHLHLTKWVSSCCHLVVEIFQQTSGRKCLVGRVSVPLDGVLFAKEHFLLAFIHFPTPYLLHSTSQKLTTGSYWHVYVLLLAISYDFGHRTSSWRHVVGGVGKQRNQKPTAVTSRCGSGRGTKKSKANRCDVTLWEW